MTYNSPFLALKQHHADIERYETWDILVWWNIDELIEETKALTTRVYSVWLENLSSDELISFIYNPTAIFWALTNLIIRNIGIDNQFLKQIIELKILFSSLAPETYKAGDGIVESLESFHLDIRNVKKDILWEGGYYRFDEKSFKSSFEWLSFRTWKEISEILDWYDTVFLALWNWGIAPWMDVYNHIDNQNVFFRVARLSMEKAWDNRPRISRKEIKDIKNKSFWWNLVIFDEDSCTGKTLRTAVKYFDPKVSVSTEIFALSNCWEFRTNNFHHGWIEY